ncbi:MAG: hypothetical protein GC188_05320 [Alphaproteobacteria bacterium]|nr:hypothetical protein [Alphaproteobacteria bacterium]
MLMRLINLVNKSVAPHALESWLDKIIVIAIDECDADGEVKEYHQVWGKIIDVVPGQSLIVQLMGKGQGFYLPLPYSDIDILTAQQGDYQLKRDGDLIRNPDFTCRIAIDPAIEGDLPEHPDAPCPAALPIPDDVKEKLQAL